MKITILGCGASAGVPLIGCNCVVCTSLEPKNKRTRASILVETAEKHILIDASPDLRMQALAQKITRVDTVLFTHAHADHCHGIDELRSFNYLGNKVLPCYSNQKTLDELMERFPFCFREPTKEFGWFRPCLRAQAVKAYEPFYIGSQKILAFNQDHGKLPSLGFRFNNFTYSTDVKAFSEESWAMLKGTETWIIDCLRYERAPTHADLSLALEWIERLRPRLAILTHMSHDFDYNSIAKQLPANVIPAYDGLKIEAV